VVRRKTSSSVLIQKKGVFKGEACLPDGNREKQSSEKRKRSLSFRRRGETKKEERRSYSNAREERFMIFKEGHEKKNPPPPQRGYGFKEKRKFVLKGHRENKKKKPQGTKFVCEGVDNGRVSGQRKNVHLKVPNSTGDTNVYLGAREKEIR